MYCGAVICICVLFMFGGDALYLFAGKCVSLSEVRFCSVDCCCTGLGYRYTSGTSPEKVGNKLTLL